jgi:hypothetical protein
MVQVTVTAAVKVAGGPTLSLSSTVEPQSYTFASVSLDPAGGAAPEQTVDLLPDGGTVVLLGVSARTAAGKAATISIKPSHGATDGATFDIDGTLLVATPGVLAALVAGGPRSLSLSNANTGAVTIDLITGLEP